MAGNLLHNLMRPPRYQFLFFFLSSSSSFLLCFFFGLFFCVNEDGTNSKGAETTTMICITCMFYLSIRYKHILTYTQTADSHAAAADSLPHSPRFHQPHFTFFITSHHVVPKQNSPSASSQSKPTLSQSPKSKVQKRQNERSRRKRK